jgi:hypothetical protein
MAQNTEVISGNFNLKGIYSSRNYAQKQITKYIITHLQFLLLHHTELSTFQCPAFNDARIT